MLQEFKDFINKGGVLEVAVGLIMALAFKPIIDALVDNVLLAFVAGIFGEPNFDLVASFHVGEALVAPGTLVTTGVSFLFVAIAMFAVIKAYNSMKGPEEPAAPAGPTDTELLVEIRDLLARR